MDKLVTQLYAVQQRMAELNTEILSIIESLAGVSVTPPTNRILSASFNTMKMHISESPMSKLRLTHFFTTQNGNWDIDNRPYSVEPWAKERFLTADFEEAGASNHLFGAVIGLDGRFEKTAKFEYRWPDGAVVNEVKNSGWANEPLFGPSSSFNPEAGQSGVWAWKPNEAADILVGGGLPMNLHVASFAVWTRLP